MFSKARISLTWIYSLVFLACFWAFSLGLVAWMELSFHDDVSDQVVAKSSPEVANADWRGVAVDLNEIALDRLEFSVVVLNVVLLFVIPSLSWYLTGKALEPVRRSHEAQRQFVSDAAHELRTPLTIIRSEIEMALKRERTSEDYGEALVSNLEEVTRLSELVERLLFLAKHDDEKDQSAFESIDLTDLLSSVLARYRIPFAERQLLLEFKPAEKSVLVLGDAIMLAMMFGNLVDNAIKFTEINGTITVSMELREAKVVIEIVDTGIGIAPEMQEKIFDRFTRADASRGQTKGHGLGLSICQAIAKCHHGIVSVSSQGQGSTFAVVLPIA